MKSLSEILLLSIVCYLLLDSPAIAQPAPAIPSKLVFSRTSIGIDRLQETYIWGTQTLPAHRIAQSGRGLMHHTMATEKPAWATTQGLSFRFRSIGLFASNPGAHFAIIGRSESTSWYNRGRGFIVGNLTGNTPGCSGVIRTQPETWWSLPGPPEWTGAKHLWADSYCGPELSENVWYEVALHVNSSGYFAYWIWQDGSLIESQLVYDNVNPEGNIIGSVLTGFSFGIVFVDNVFSSWTLEFDYLTVSWW